MLEKRDVGNHNLQRQYLSADDFDDVDVLDVVDGVLLKMQNGARNSFPALCNPPVLSNHFSVPSLPVARCPFSPRWHYLAQSGEYILFLFF